MTKAVLISRIALVLFTLAAIGLSGYPARVAHATTFTVTSTNESGPGSLRQAIADANSGDTITFDPGILPGTITLTSGSYFIVDKDLTINGPGAGDLAIDGNDSSRAFLISGGTVAISDVTIQNGSAFGNGGGIANVNGSLTITNVTVNNNTATDGGGGIFNTSGGTLTITNSTISGNSVDGRGGGIRNLNSGTLTITNSTITGNSAGSLGGGVENGTALPTQTQLTITNSTITGNSTGSLGGGVRNLGTGELINTIVAGNPVRRRLFRGWSHFSWAQLGQRRHLHPDGPVGLA